ncbi:MAG: flagellar basal body protein, partial [Balneolales bacterium]|nr:flagellar basal body protein [Balneolales bacterium]
MALVRSLNSGVSGLNAFQAKMDVIGNNIANVDTIGFKSSTITFAEMMNQNLGRENPDTPSRLKLFKPSMLTATQDMTPTTNH